MYFLVVLIGFLLAIPAFFLRLIIRFISLGCNLFKVKHRTQAPKCLQDPIYGEHKFVKSGSVSLHYVESGDQDKPLMVFVHGWPEFWYSWRHQIKYFQKNYHVIALDMRGYNDSSKPSGVDNYYIPILVNDLKNLVESTGKTTFTLVAHDWGGIVAWTFAALHPAMVDNLVVCNIPHPVALNDLRKTNFEQVLKSWYIIFFQCPVLPELSCMAEDMAFFKRIFRDAGLHEDTEMLEAYKYAFRDYKTWNRTINYYRCAVKEEEKYNNLYKSQLSDVKPRTLCIFGTADKALSVNAAQQSSKYAKDFKLELIEGVSHWVQQEVPDKVNSLIEQFIQK